LVRTTPREKFCMSHPSSPDDHGRPPVNFRGFAETVRSPLVNCR
jgi:hypothetical protein